ncbi:hypothetical protein pb186bvf_006031 [Paramecium bursaria]
MVSYQLVNQNLNMNGTGGQLYANYLVVIYQTQPQNYSIILSEIGIQYQLPIISYLNRFLGVPINFFFTQDGQVVYTVDQGFAYIQIFPYIYVGINNKYLDLTLISQNYDTLTTQTILDIIISNPFYNKTLKINLTITNQLGIPYYEFHFFHEFKLFIILASILVVFFIFIGYKIHFAEKQFE